jgi:SAM-dependent methyltransferase
VQGIDADAAIVAQARELTRPAAPVTFTVGDALSDIPPGSYDVITCVAAIHHLPFSEALTRFRRHLAPGGTLVVVGLAHAQSLGDRLLGAADVPSNVAMAWVKNKGRKAARPASMTAPTRPATMSFPDIVRDARRCPARGSAVDCSGATHWSGTGAEGSVPRGRTRSISGTTRRSDGKPCRMRASRSSNRPRGDRRWRSAQGGVRARGVCRVGPLGDT